MKRAVASAEGIKGQRVNWKSSQVERLLPLTYNRREQSRRDALMSNRKKKMKADLGVFLRQYRRRRQAGSEPNDRTYDRTIEKMVKRMDPVELDQILRGEDDEPDEQEL
jgi:hypothetical protein